MASSHPPAPPDAFELARRLRAGALRPADAIDRARARIRERNPTVNAVVRVYDAVEPASAGPFAGVPLLLKDLLAAEAGRLLTAGSALRATHRPDHDTEMVRRLQAAGFVNLGRTNTPEFGMMVTTEPALYGPCRNPHAPERTAGGSSGGAAAAVASGMVAVAHATDGGGSIRIPASCCGVFGFKPGRGVNPLEAEHTDMLGGLTAEHVITRSVRDSAAVLLCVGDVAGAPGDLASGLADLAQPPPPLRIRVLDGIWHTGPPHPDVRAGLDAAAALCADRGHAVERGALPGRAAPVADAFARFYCIQAHQTLQAIGRARGRPVAVDEIEPLTWAMAERGSTYNARAYLDVVDTLHDAQTAVHAAFAEFDVLLTPTLATPPIRIGRLNGARTDVAQVFAERLAFSPNTALFNITGQPAMSVPLGISPSGLPIGMQFVAAPGQDWTLMRLAHDLEPHFRPALDPLPHLR